MTGQNSTATARAEQLDLATVTAIWQAVSGEIVLEKLLERISRTAIEYAGARLVLLILPHGSELRIEAEASRGETGVTVRLEKQAAAATVVPISIIRYAVRTGEPVIIADASAPNPFSNDDYVASKQARSVLCLPLLNQGEVVAVLYLENNLAAGVFIPRRVEILKLLAAAAAGSLETSRHFEEIRQRETERKLIEEQLRRTATYVADAQRLAHTGTWASDGTTQPLYWSEEVFRIFGFDPQHGLPSWEQPLQRIHPEDREKFWQAFQKTLREKVDVELEYRVVLPDGIVRYVHSVAHPVTNPNEAVQAVGTIIDITERKRAEEELRRSEAYLADAQRLTHTGSWAYDVVSSHYVYMSEECFRIFEVSPREHSLPNRETISQLIHPDDRGRVWGDFDRSLREKADVSSEFRIVLHSGRVKHLHTIRHPVMNEAGDVIELFGTVIDITERKHAEEAIHQSERHLRNVIETIPVMAYTARPDGSTEFVNRRWLEYTGLTAEETGPYRLNSMHPEDKEAHTRKWQVCLATGEPFENEVRHRGGNGQYRWFLVRSVPLRDEQGNILKWFGTLTDIEDRKTAEESVRSENIALREELDKAPMFGDIVGTSPALRAVLAAASKVASKDATVLITGETGTGKELIARAIHRQSLRSSGPFVSVNCGAIPQALIASELFGHEKGAFTGALQRRLGRFELAERGTIFLDEVGDLPFDTQIALLRVLQEKEFERVGGSHTIRSDARIIAATNRNLEAAIAAGNFRSDLFYRLSVFPIRVPSLRERREDISLLVEFFIDRFARKANKRITKIEKRTLQLLQSFSWPGNVRELRNLIERAVIICESDTLTVDQSWLSFTAPLPPAPNESLARKSVAEEREIIERALSEAHGKVAGPSGAAAKLGIPASTLESKIRLLKINKYRYRNHPAAE